MMVLDVQNVHDLYFWQVAISFDAKEMMLMSVTPGVFPNCEYPGILVNTDNSSGLLTVGDFLLRPQAGWSGSGTLATISFGFFADGYALPKISMSAAQETTLLDSSGNAIPLDQQTTLSLSPS
jgi:hypothetical protein